MSYREKERKKLRLQNALYFIKEPILSKGLLCRQILLLSGIYRWDGGRKLDFCLGGSHIFLLEADLMARRALQTHQAFSYSSYLEAEEDLEQE